MPPTNNAIMSAIWMQPRSDLVDLVDSSDSENYASSNISKNTFYLVFGYIVAFTVAILLVVGVVVGYARKRRKWRKKIKDWKQKMRIGKREEGNTEGRTDSTLVVEESTGSKILTAEQVLGIDKNSYLRSVAPREG
jgi:hypothetical protein